MAPNANQVAFFREAKAKIVARKLQDPARALVLQEPTVVDKKPPTRSGVGGSCFKGLCPHLVSRRRQHQHQALWLWCRDYQPLSVIRLRLRLLCSTV